ncbi:MAG: CPBP family intramembrane metalloprotease, partial [Lachnospiraceae bacterium]|nr:CPBP family intramembrane metalloprotease [Lachnospiraceae bacterium]
MKKSLICNLTPLQNRIKKELPPEPTSFFKAFSIISPIIIYYVVSQLIILLFAYFMQWVSGQEGTWQQIAEWFRTNSMAVSGTVKGLSLIIGVATVFTIFIKETPVIKLPIKYKKDIGFLFFLGASAALSVNIFFSLLGFTGSSASYEQVAEKQFAFPLWAGILLYGIVSPLAEEIVFRGIVYNRMRRQYSLWTALFGSGLLFGLYHGNIVQAVYGFLLGLLIGLIYEKYGSFLVP